MHKCIGMRMDMCINMCTGMFSDLWIGIWMDMRIEVSPSLQSCTVHSSWVHPCGNVRVHACMLWRVVAHRIPMSPAQSRAPRSGTLVSPRPLRIAAHLGTWFTQLYELCR